MQTIQGQISPLLPTCPCNTMRRVNTLLLYKPTILHKRRPHTLLAQYCNGTSSCSTEWAHLLQAGWQLMCWLPKQTKKRLSTLLPAEPMEHYTLELLALEGAH